MDIQYFLPCHVIHGTYAYGDDLDLDYNKIFLNSFHLENREAKYTDKGHDISYVLNTKNYRSPEFISDVDAIFAGCSNTYGVGLPEEARWSNILANKLNLSFVNLAIPGASVFLILSEIMHYIKVYGKPKYIFCMFPDFARTTLYVKHGLNAPYDGLGDYGLTQTHLMSHGNIEDRPKYIKKPFAYDDVMSLETSYFYSLKAIQFLEYFCDILEIKLYWGALWDLDSEMLSVLKNNEFGYYSHFIAESGIWDRITDEPGKDQYVVRVYDNGFKDISVNCHEEYRKIFPKHFDMASDTEFGIEGAHLGFHRNIHIAEKFYSLIDGDG